MKNKIDRESFIFRRASRNFQRGYKVAALALAITITPIQLKAFPKHLDYSYWKNRERVVFQPKEKKEDFFKSDIWTRNNMIKLSLKQAKKDLEVAKRNLHNKSLDGLTCKERRAQKTGKLYGRAWYLKYIKNESNS